MPTSKPKPTKAKVSGFLPADAAAYLEKRAARELRSLSFYVGRACIEWVARERRKDARRAEGLRTTL